MEESLKDFDTAVARDARYADIMWQRGLTLYYLDRFDEAAQQVYCACAHTRAHTVTERCLTGPKLEDDVEDNDHCDHNDDDDKIDHIDADDTAVSTRCPIEPCRFRGGYLELSLPRCV